MSDAEPGPFVSIADLRAALDLLLTAVEDQMGETVDLAADYYWELDARAAFDMVDEPGPHIRASQLTDDVAELLDMSSGPDREVAVWHDAEHLAAVIRRIGSLALPEGDRR